MEENKVLAKVEDIEITQDDLNNFLNELGPQVAMQFQTQEGMDQILEELVNQELLYLDAKKNKLDESPAFKSIVEETLANLLKSYAVTQLIAAETATEEEMKKFYEENPTLFKNEEKADASHILVDTEEEANNILKEIEEGLSFGEAAAKYSSCPSKEAGGKLGEFSRGQMVPEFEEKAFSMEIDEISEPVKTQFGYHLIQLHNLAEAGEKSFEEVRPQIEQTVIRMKQQETYLNKIKELKDEYTVEITE